MALTINCRALLDWLATFDGDSSGLPLKDENDLSPQLVFTDGTAANQCDKYARERRTIASGANHDYDLTALPGRDGSTVSLARLKLMMVVQRETTVARILSIGNGGANSFNSWCGASDTAVIEVHAGGLLLVGNPLATGYAVTAGTGDILRFAASGGGSVTYDVFFAGASA
jgi:hypothetical protein